jgi:hypothetical protein
MINHLLIEMDLFSIMEKLGMSPNKKLHILLSISIVLTMIKKYQN